MLRRFLRSVSAAKQRAEPTFRRQAGSAQCLVGQTMAGGSRFNGASSLSSTSAIGMAAAAMAFMGATVTSAAICDAKRELNVDEVIALYHEVDVNMRIMAQKLMEALAHEIDLEMEKEEIDRLSVEQRAIQMSDTFERVLGQVQDSVFRNNGVTKEQVIAAMQRIESGAMQLSQQDADAIQDYIRKLGRLRWECTGSREPISRQGIQRPKPETTPIPRHVLLNMSKELIPSLTKEMEIIVDKFKKDKADLHDQVIRQRLAKLYLEASQRVTEAIAVKYKVSVEDFQEALLFFHDDAAFQVTITQLTEQQHQRFVDLGL
ncbi:hypothetical protein AeMF1_018445 [Aphanomyces euteiches]|nr:hypothetical protein AeMF1_018445 [Aphanomyces euteiches]KAH9186492.1 hypothetical protein AeNC1_011529 [Aphanomyces euteiches]